MKCERIGLRFSKNDEDIISWFLMLREHGIEQSFAVKALLKAFFLNENINAGTVRIRHKVCMDPTSIAINEIELNNDMRNIKSQGIKLASFTRDIIRSYINIGENDSAPEILTLQKIHNKYKLKYLNRIVSSNIDEFIVTKDNENNYYDSNSSNIIHDDIGSNKSKFKNIEDNSDNKIDKTNTQVNPEIKSKQNYNDYTNKLSNDKESSKGEIIKKPKNKKRNPLLAQI